jgi:phosphoribosylformylglycinamidine synthase
MDVKTPNESIYIVGKTFRELGGSEYYRMRGFLGKTVPHVRAAQGANTFKAITKAMDSGLIKACHDLSEGGLGVAAAEMALAGGYGVKLDLRKVPAERSDRDDFILFSESNSRFLVEVSDAARKRFEVLMRRSEFGEIGKVTKEPRLNIIGLNDESVVDVSINDLETSWKRTFSTES